MTIQIPDDLARGLERIASEQNISVEQLAVERLRALFARPTSPSALLRALRSLAHPSSLAVDDLEAAITEGRLSIQDRASLTGDRHP